MIKLMFAALAAAILFCAALPDHGVKATAESLSCSGATKQNEARNNPHLILFARGAVDTHARADLDTAASDLLVYSGSISTQSSSARKELRIVQFAGPIKRGWVEQLKASGAEIISYIPNNAYIIRGTAREIARAAAFDRGIPASPIQWMGRFEAAQKFHPAYDDDLLASNDYEGVEVEVELLDSVETAAAIEQINKIAYGVNHAPRRFLKFIVLSVTVPIAHLRTVAELDEVLFIGPAPRPTLHDERSVQIAAGNLIPDGTQPAGPGYLEWLASKGLATRPDFLIDFTDTGLDRGSTSENMVHPDFLDAEGRSRVGYNTNYTRESAEDHTGHGTIVASVACGLGSRERADAAGYQFGMGVDPRARLGASRIFEAFGRLPFRFSFTTAVSAAYAAGARISNNSWGNRGNTYDVGAQEYDALTRDAQPAVAGNQEMVFIFSAGNGGPGGHISSPGTAKNVITVAASENFRPEGIDSCNLDGGGAIGPDGADNALDILRFSSGGPTSDGRAKPDITAPGTHIYGAASRATFFNGAGLCPGIPVYQPPGQEFYTWSSGTSLAAPHVSGAASLLRRYFTLRNLLGDGRPPSPAMMKAYLINSASYLTGENAGGSLPGERQGWGRVNLAPVFDNTARVLIDQTRVFTESDQTFEIRGSLADRSKPLRVTLAWTDAPGTPGGAVLVNDLDLEIAVGGVRVYRGNNLAGEFSAEGGEADRLNNVESIYLPASVFPEGVEGNFTITVRARNIAGDGLPGNGVDLDQDFALVVSNIADPINPSTRKIPVIATATYIQKVLTITGRDFTAAARVEINGQIIDDSFTFDAAANSLRIKKKRRKLGLNTGADNQIILIENGERSQPFTLRL